MKNAIRFTSFTIWPIFFAIIFYYYNEILSGGNGYKTGDWLINYAGGPVRRGLIGELLYYFSGFGVSLKWLTYFVQAAFYFLIFFLTQRIYLMRERGIEWLILLFSPAFIFFAFYDFQGGFRKEIIVFVSFLVLASAYAKQDISIKSIIASFVIFLLSVFSHELAAFTLPFFIYILFNSFRSGQISHRLALVSILFFSASALAALLFSLAFPGGKAVEIKICNSVVSKGFSNEICGGAIHWIGLDAKYALQTVSEKLRSYLLVYPLLFIYAIFPLVISDWTKKNLAFLLIGFGFIFPLFIVATDWGRWLHIYIFFAFTLMLAESVWRDVKIIKLPITVLVVYLTAWSIPHYGAHNSGYGFAGPLFDLWWQ